MVWRVPQLVMELNGKLYHHVSAVFSMSCNKGATKLRLLQCLHRTGITIKASHLFAIISVITLLEVGTYK